MSALFSIRKIIVIAYKKIIAKILPSFVLLVTTGLWPKELDGAYCAVNYEYSSVSNQAECQDLCKAKESCVGISYYLTACRACEDDNLNHDGGSYDFYRRPG